MSSDVLAELGLTWQEAGLVVLTALAIYVVTLVAARVFGQRQFATLSSHDLVFVFALGSIIGRVVLVRTSLLAAVLGLATMFSVHAVMSLLHHRLAAVHRAIQNSPVLVLAHGSPLDDQLRRAHLSEVELRQALREQGQASYRDLQAVILEPGGRLSCISAGADIAPEFLWEVDGASRLAQSA